MLQLLQRKTSFKKLQKKKGIAISKRQKFVIATFVLSVGLFVSEFFFGQYTIGIAILLAVLTDILFGVSLFNDLRKNFSPFPFILPFFYSLSFVLFYFLTPARFLSRIIITTLYAVGFYSLFLSENIFVVASIRTIALLNSARIVTFVVTLLSFFFLTNIIFSIRALLLPTLLGLVIISFFLTFHSLWTYSLENSLTKHIMWVSVVSLCLFELATALWFWPTSPTVIALFLTAVFYILISLTHMWFEKRLFRSVFSEYIWVAVVAFIILIWFTSWQG